MHYWIQWFDTFHWINDVLVEWEIWSFTLEVEQTERYVDWCTLSLHLVKLCLGLYSNPPWNQTCVKISCKMSFFFSFFFFFLDWIHPTFHIQNTSELNKRGLEVLSTQTMSAMNLHKCVFSVFCVFSPSLVLWVLQAGSCYPALPFDLIARLQGKTVEGLSQIFLLQWSTNQTTWGWTWISSVHK